MIDLIINDIHAAFTNVLGNEYPILGILAIIGVAGGFLMKNISQVFGRAAQGTFFFGILQFLYHGFASAERFTLDNWEAQAISGWNNLMGLDTQKLIGYMAVLLILTMIGFGVSALLKSR